MSTASTAAMNAAGASLRIPSSDVAQVVDRLKQGLPYRAVTSLQKNSGLSLESISRAIQAPRRTLDRRKSAGRLTRHESERLYRLALVCEKAATLFEGDREAARDWLTSPCKALGGATPLAMAETEIGAREVENVIGRLEHGVFS